MSALTSWLVLLAVGAVAAILVRRVRAEPQLALFLALVPPLGVGASFVFC